MGPSHDQEWTIVRETLPQHEGEVWSIEAQQRRISFGQFFGGLGECERHRNSLLRAWSDTPYSSFVWELPPLTRPLLDADFESVVLSEPALSKMSASSISFRDHFATTERAISFANLGGDAKLVAPCPGRASSDNAHLASFARTGARPETHAALALLGSEVLCSIDMDPKWISTSGLGVPWLHFRIDRRPKYYQFAPYRQIS